MMSSRSFRMRVARRRQVEILGQLLRDGAGPPRCVALLERVLQRLADLFHVDAFVSEEGAVLRDDDGPLEVRRDPPVRHPPLHLTDLASLGAGLRRAQLHEAVLVGLVLASCRTSGSVT
jgi:hypothetical protein